MIRIERPSAPAGFNKFAKAARAEALEFYSRDETLRRQEKFEFQERMPENWLKLILSALQKVFNGKCAYCESIIERPQRSSIDWFRPRGGVAEEDGDYLSDHYWMQAFAWENMYLCCARCNRAKGNRFPVQGARADAGAAREALEDEYSLLLDPCEDVIAKHLEFGDDGVVMGLSNKGMVTIEVLNLNGDDLLRIRGRVAAEYLIAIGQHGATKGAARALALGHQPYLGLKASIRKRRATFVSRAEDDSYRHRRIQEDYDLKKEDATVDTKSGLRKLRSRARFITRVELENVASIESLSMDFDASSSVAAPCFAILGDNGVGKSTLLKAIALAIAGDEARKQAGVRASEFLRSGSASGAVRVWISGFRDPIIMRLDRSTDRFISNGTGQRILILAYGATRLLPSRRSGPVESSQSGGAVKIQNLFDPFRPLSDASAWLAGIEQPDFERVAATLKDILSISTEAHLSRDNGIVKVRIGSGEEFPLSQLSDGFQTMLGLAVDIISMMSRFGFKSMQSAQGVVLIDEIGNHLHPQWRMKVVRLFRRAFPQIQFIVSTHDPLCLRGIVEGEVAVLRRAADGRVYALENLPSVEHMRVDQILSSEHFGLGSLVDPWTPEFIEELNSLAFKDAKELTASESERYEEMKRGMTASHLLAARIPDRAYYTVASEEFRRLTGGLQGSVNVAALEERVAQELRLLKSMSSGDVSDRNDGRGLGAGGGDHDPS